MKYTNIIEEIDPKYYEEANNKGTVERVDYTATNYDGSRMDKHAYVYLPYNYDPSEKYEILYLIHGGGETAEKYIYQNGEENPLKRAVDNMIEMKEIKPVIIVTPSEYPYHKITTKEENNMVNFVSYFHNELVEELLPVVESKYSTYNSRDHRSVMGWSMGSMTTWCVFLNRIADFSKFGFLSCHAGLVETGDEKWAEHTCMIIDQSVKKQGYKKEDYAIYAITGDQDIVYPMMNPMMNELRNYTDILDFEGENQNATYLVWPEGEHHTKWRLQYTINALKQFYK